MAEAGRPTDLTDELIKEIKQSILGGRNIKETAIYIFENYPNLGEKEKGNGVDNYIQKFYNWNCDNYLDMADKVEGWKRDRKLMLAEKKLEDILDFDVSDKDTIKVQADIAKFTAETLGKKTYSKRSEHTGAEGEPLIKGFIYEKPDKL